MDPFVIISFTVMGMLFFAFAILPFLLVSSVAISNFFRRKKLKKRPTTKLRVEAGHRVHALAVFGVNGKRPIWENEHLLLPVGEVLLLAKTQPKDPDDPLFHRYRYCNPIRLYKYFYRDMILCRPSRATHPFEIAFSAKEHTLYTLHRDPDRGFLQLSWVENGTEYTLSFGCAGEEVPPLRTRAV